VSAVVNIQHGPRREYGIRAEIELQKGAVGQDREVAGWSSPWKKTLILLF
jgi:hypothetical protein